MKRYLKVWWLMSRNSFSMVLSQKLSFGVFLTGKILRFLFFFGFLYFLLLGTNNLAGYNSDQAIFFFLTFNIIDIISQFLFREAYRFRPMIVNGDFDFVLIRPINALFRVLMGGADVIDFITIPPIIILTAYFGTMLGPSFFEVILYLALLINGFLIATAFHILVLSMAIITLEIDHSIMIYRDLTSLGRLPIDIYKEPLKGFITYFIPVGIMMSLPVKAMLGLVSPVGIVLAFAIGTAGMIVSLKFWKFALKKYSSASS